MKHLILTLILTLALTSCSFLPTKFDNNEYEMLARLETRISMINEKCNDNSYVKHNLPIVEYDVRTLHSYTFYTPGSREIYEIVDILKQDIIEIKYQYHTKKGNETYCRIKTNILLEKIRQTMESVANKVRG